MRFAEKIFIVLGLTSFQGVLFVFPKTGIVPQAAITLIKYLVWTVLIILSGIFCKNIVMKAVQNILVCILTLIIFLSFLWSDFPTFTLLNATDILMMTLFGLYFAARFSLKEQVELVAFTLLFGAFISTVIALGFPRVGIDYDLHIGAWKGIYSQKNAFGGAMLLSLLTFFTLPRKNLALYKWFGFSFSFLLILLSTSRTSFVLSFLLMLIMMLYKNFRWNGKISVIFLDIGILLTGCVAILIFSYWVEIITGLGRDTTFTGRIPLWGFVITKLIERPFLGYGVGAFWADGSKYAIEASQVVADGKWIPPHAHNGFLDLGIGIGLIGLSIFLIVYFTTFALALKKSYATTNLEDLWPFGFLIFLTLNNITESYLLNRYSMYWILFITIAFTLNQKTTTQNNNFANKTYSPKISTLRG